MRCSSHVQGSISTSQTIYLLTVETRTFVPVAAHIYVIIGSISVGLRPTVQRSRPSIHDSYSSTVARY